jgi:hypothetical protein
MCVPLIEKQEERTGGQSLLEAMEASAHQKEMAGAVFKRLNSLGNVYMDEKSLEGGKSTANRHKLA